MKTNILLEEKLKKFLSSINYKISKGYVPLFETVGQGKHKLTFVENLSGFTLEELELANEIIGLGIKNPPKCVCGQNNYRFSLWKGKDGKNEIIYIKAQCRNCRFQRYYNSVTKVWGPVFGEGFLGRVHWWK